MAPSAVSHLSPELLDGTELRSGPTLITTLSNAECDLGVLAIVREPGDRPFGREEAALAQDFSTRAAALIAHLQAKGTREARAIQNDRERIAANLHDLVIQPLFGMGLRLQSLTAQADAKEIAGDIHDCVEQIDETILAIRRSIFALRQPVSDQIGLRSQILNIVTATPFGFDPTVHFDGPINSAVPDFVLLTPTENRAISAN